MKLKVSIRFDFYRKISILENVVTIVLKHITAHEARPVRIDNIAGVPPVGFQRKDTDEVNIFYIINMILQKKGRQQAHYCSKFLIRYVYLICAT